MNFKDTRDSVASLLQAQFTAFQVTKKPFYSDLNLDSKEIRITVLPGMRKVYIDSNVSMQAHFSILCRGEHTSDIDESANNSIVLALEVLSFLSEKLSLSPVKGSEPVQLALYSDFSIIYEVQFFMSYDYEYTEEIPD